MVTDLAIFLDVGKWFVIHDGKSFNYGKTAIISIHLEKASEKENKEMISFVL